MCEEFEVQGYPTLYYGDPTAPETYEGARSYEALAEFAEETLSAKVCSVYDTEMCSKEEKKVIEEFRAKPTEELSAMAAEIEKLAADAEAEFDEKATDIQKQYEKIVDEYNEKVEGMKEEHHYKLMRAVLAQTESTIDEL